MNNEFETKVLSILLSMQNDIATLKDSVSSLQSDVSSLQSDVSSLQSDVSSLQSDVSSLQDDMSILKENYKNLEAITLRMEHKFEEKIAILFDAFKLLNDKIESLKTSFSYYETILANHSLRLDILEQKHGSAS